MSSWFRQSVLSWHDCLIHLDPPWSTLVPPDFLFNCVWGQDLCKSSKAWEANPRQGAVATWFSGVFVNGHLSCSWHFWRRDYTFGCFANTEIEWYSRLTGTSELSRVSFTIFLDIKHIKQRYNFENTPILGDPWWPGAWDLPITATGTRSPRLWHLDAKGFAASWSCLDTQLIGLHRVDFPQVMESFVGNMMINHVFSRMRSEGFPFIVGGLGVGPLFAASWSARRFSRRFRVVFASFSRRFRVVFRVVNSVSIGEAAKLRVFCDVDVAVSRRKAAEPRFFLRRCHSVYRGSCKTSCFLLRGCRSVYRGSCKTSCFLQRRCRSVYRGSCKTSCFLRRCRSVYRGSCKTSCLLRRRCRSVYRGSCKTSFFFT